MDKVRKLFYEISDRNICPNVVTYSALINGLCKEGKLQEASKLFYEMSHINICPSVVTYNVLIDGLGKEGKLDEARKIFYEMPSINIFPNVVHTIPLLMVYVRNINGRRPPKCYMRC